MPRPSRSAQKKNGYVGSGVDCPICGQSARFQGYRDKTVLSLLGTAACQRAYYYCGRCGHGVIPWDQAAGLTARAFTPATERLVSLAGILGDSFAEAADKILPEMAGLRVAETTVQRTTEGAGQRLSTQRQQRRVFGFPRRWDWHRDAHGRRCTYLSLDLTGVGQQAAYGGTAHKHCSPVCVGKLDSSANRATSSILAG